MASLNISLSEIREIELSEKIMLDRPTVYKDVITEIKNDLAEKIEMSESKEGPDSSDLTAFETFLTSASAHGIGPITYEQMDQVEAYKAGYTDWLNTQINHAIYLESQDYMTEFADIEDEDLEDSIRAWAYESIDSVAYDSSWMILARFS